MQTLNLLVFHLQVGTKSSMTVQGYITASYLVICSIMGRGRLNT